MRIAPRTDIYILPEKRIKLYLNAMLSKIMTELSDTKKKEVTVELVQLPLQSSLSALNILESWKMCWKH